MPTSGSIVTFRQSLPLYADKKFVENTFSASSYKTITEDIIILENLQNQYQSQ